MQRIFLALLAILLLATVTATAYGLYRTWKTGKSADYGRFLSGSLPTGNPEGLWGGTAEELGEVSWKGKKFLPDNAGINLFEGGGKREEKYRFTFSDAASLSDNKKQVIRIDYNQPGNPLWLRFIVDEMVSEGEHRFLGAVYITAIPGVPFRMGYFRLEKDTE